jgi:hypothetical protein
MTSQLNVDTIADKAGSGPVGLHKQHAAKAWVGSYDFSDDSVLDSFNVGTFTDNGNGELITNFSSAMANAGFSTTVSDNNYSLIMVAVQTTGSTRTDSHTTAFAAWNGAIQKLTVHGDLA